MLCTFSLSIAEDEKIFRLEWAYGFQNLRLFPIIINPPSLVSFYLNPPGFHQMSYKLFFLAWVTLTQSASSFLHKWWNILVISSKCTYFVNVVSSFHTFRPKSFLNFSWRRVSHMWALISHEEGYHIYGP
jgi:hypothetical protein